MTEKVQNELREELENSSLEEILGLLCLYTNSPDERDFVKKFVLDNFEKKK